NYEAKAGINKINSTNTIENSYIISNLFFTTIETRRLIIDLFDEKIINFRRYDELEELHEETINNIKSNITIFHQFIENSLNDLTNYYNNKVEDKDEYRDGEERSILRDNLYNRMIKIIKIFPERFVLDKLSNMNHYYILERICEERHAEWLNEKINVDLDYGYNRWYFNLLGKIGNADSASLCYKFISTNIDTILQNEVIENDNNDFYNCLITTIESFGLLVDKFNLSRDTQYTNLIEKIVFNPKYTERIRVAAMDYILLNNLTSYQDKIVLLLNEKLPERDSWDNSIAGWINHGYIKNVPQKAREILASFGIPEHVNYIYQILLQEKIPDSFHVIIMNILKANRIASQFTNTLCELIITGKKENHKKIFDYIAMRYQNRTHTLTVWDKNLTLYQLKMINSLKMDLSIAEVSSINTFSLSIHRDIYQDILEIRNEIDNFSLTYLPNVEPIASGEYKEVFNKIKTICKKISE
ncbi:MAG: hypothetical protein OEZ01_03000, partial [Candidatus Heimdallarchaeota archaeon]|nr:hypothetical protein [Candidatus Heimdallarchaeota archaeon]